MNLIQFAQLVLRMRDLQRKAVRLPGDPAVRSDLGAATAAVDRAITRILLPDAGKLPPTLYPVDLGDPGA